MFDQIVGEKTARKPFALAVSISGQVAVARLGHIISVVTHTSGHVTTALAGWFRR